MGQLNCSQIPHNNKNIKLTVYDTNPYRFWVQSSTGGVQYDTITKGPKQNPCVVIQKHLKSKHKIIADPLRHKKRFKVIQIAPGQYCVLYKLRKTELNKFDLRPVKAAWKSKSLAHWIAALSATAVVGYAMKLTYDHFNLNEVLALIQKMNFDEPPVQSGFCVLKYKMITYDIDTQEFSKHAVSSKCSYGVGFLLVKYKSKIVYVNAVIVSSVRSLDVPLNMNIFAPSHKQPQNMFQGRQASVFKWKPQQGNNLMESLLWCEWFICDVIDKVRNDHSFLEIVDSYKSTTVEIKNNVDQHIKIWSNETPKIDGYIHHQQYYKVLRNKFVHQWTQSGNVHWGNQVDIVALQVKLKIGIIITRYMMMEVQLQDVSTIYETYIIIDNSDNAHYELVEINGERQFTCDKLPNHIVDQLKLNNNCDGGKEYEKKLIKTIPNKGGGDCLFLAVQQSLPDHVTVKDLRDMVGKYICALLQKDFIDLFNQTLLYNEDKWDMASIRPVLRNGTWQ